jgi:uncharacterized membrane protein
MAKKIAKKQVKKEKMNYEVPSFVLGIISIVFAFVSPLAGLVLGIVGLVQSKKQSTTMSMKAKKLNKIGIIIAAIVLIATILFTALMGSFETFPGY